MIGNLASSIILPATAGSSFQKIKASYYQFRQIQSEVYYQDLVSSYPSLNSIDFQFNFIPTFYQYGYFLRKFFLFLKRDIVFNFDHSVYTSSQKINNHKLIITLYVDLAGVLHGFIQADRRYISREIYDKIRSSMISGIKGYSC